MAHTGPVMSRQDTNGLGVAMKIAVTIGDPTHDGGQDGLDIGLTDTAQQREAVDWAVWKGRGEVWQDADEGRPTGHDVINEHYGGRSQTQPGQLDSDGTVMIGWVRPLTRSGQCRLAKRGDTAQTR